MRVFEALSQATRLLREKGTPNPRLDAELLLASHLSTDRCFLLAHLQDELSASNWRDYLLLITQRCLGRPVQHLIGRQEFRGIQFEVNAHVLIPRPETELVVDEVIERMESESILVDVGTGSGCIAICLALELSNAKVLATDISETAIQIAKRNAATHQVLRKIQFLQGDLLHPLGALGLQGTLGCVISNPPYVSEKDYPGLQREVRDWEPKLALVAGNNGLGIYERLVPQAHLFLKPGGYLIMEIGFSMEEAVCGLLGNGWQLRRIKRDLSGIPRVVVAQKVG